MSYARPLLEAYPRAAKVHPDALTATIDALSDCAQACAADADDDLSEPNLNEMVKCIRLCLDCAEVCATTVGVLSRQTEYDVNVTRPLLAACLATCAACGAECEHHAHSHEHCRICGEACRRAERACQDLLTSMH